MTALLASPPVHHQPCTRHYTITGYEHWITRHARHAHIPQASKPRMWTLERCQKHGQPARLAGIRWRIRYLRGQAWDQTHPLLSATASWFDDSGSTACGTHYTLGFAHLPPMPCGTRVELCATRCAVGIREDAGPYVSGRTFDLNPGLKATLGCSDLCTVRYRVLGSATTQPSKGSR